MQTVPRKTKYGSSQRVPALQSVILKYKGQITPPISAKEVKLNHKNGRQLWMYRLPPEIL